MDEDTLDELLHVMTEPLKYSWGRNDYINNHHADSLCEDLKRSLSLSLIGFDGIDFDSGMKLGSNLEALQKDRVVPLHFIDLQWTRMVAVF